MSSVRCEFPFSRDAQRSATALRCASRLNAARSAPTRPEEVAADLVFPADLAAAVQLEGALALMAGHEEMTVGQGRRRGRHRRVHLDDQFALHVVLSDLVAIGLRDEDAAGGQQVDAAGPAGLAIGGKALELLAGRVEDDALAGLRQADDVAV